jgi:diguanylate cyclase (GGDEF)-like protein
MSFLRHSILALRILVWVLVTSLAVFFAITALGVLHERNQIIERSHAEAKRTVEANLGALGVALWSYDHTSLDVLLRGIVRDGSIVRVEVLEGNQVFADVVHRGAEERVDRQWELPLMAPAGDWQIGVARVSESDAEIDRNIVDAASTLILTELVKVIGLAFVLFVIVYRQAARHIHHLAEQVRVLDPTAVLPQVQLDRPGGRQSRDELDILVEAINRFLAERGAEMSRRTSAEATLQENVSEMEAILGALSDGVIGVGRDACIVYANRAASELLDGVDALERRELSAAFRVVDAAGTGELADWFAPVLARGARVQLRGQVRICTPGGQGFDARIAAVPATGSRALAMIVVFTDISSEISKERRIEFQAFHDPLTELGNRALLARDLARELTLARDNGAQVAVLSVDLDNFKNINDALGHSVGDDLLRELAERLRQSVLPPEWLTRHGGDEFIIVVPCRDPVERAAQVARQVMAEIARPFRTARHELRVTSSIGISIYPDHGQSIAELISNADMAMYEAKHAGRNAYRYYETDLLRQSTKRLSLENALRVALMEQQFSLVFQPRVVIGSGRVDAVEALLRWRRDELETPGPDVFIPIAEEMGLIVEIGEWVLYESLAAARHFRQQFGRGLPVAVNVSPVQFRSERLIAVLSEMAAEEAHLGELLEIELTESALAGDVAEVIAKLQAIKRLGLKIAIDDFGTGYSSLAYLKNLPVNILKIDQAFIRDLHANPQDQAIVAAVVQLGQSLGFEVVAEGVEEDAHVTILAAMACDFAQGYWFSRPLSESELVRRLRAGDGVLVHP